METRQGKMMDQGALVSSKDDVVELMSGLGIVGYKESPEIELSRSEQCAIV